MEQGKYFTLTRQWQWMTPAFRFSPDHQNPQPIIYIDKWFYITKSRIRIMERTFCEYQHFMIQFPQGSNFKGEPSFPTPESSRLCKFPFIICQSDSGGVLNWIQVLALKSCTDLNSGAHHPLSPVIAGYSTPQKERNEFEPGIYSSQ